MTAPNRPPARPAARHPLNYPAATPRLTPARLAELSAPELEGARRQLLWEGEGYGDDHPRLAVVRADLATLAEEQAHRGDIARRAARPSLTDYRHAA